MTAAAFIMGGGLNYYAINAGYGINGVACGTSAAYCAYCFTVFYYVLRYRESPFKILRFFIKMTAPLVYAAAIVIGVEYFIRIDNHIGKACAQAAIFCLAYLPALWYINKTTSVFSMLSRKKIGNEVKIDVPFGV
jgi:O-antigen/teichoic acid export membrane protein